jgi:hypothetical protein
MEHETNTRFAHGKVDPREAGAKGGRAPRLTPMARRLIAGVVDSNNGAAKVALARDLGLLERQVPAPEDQVKPDYDAVFARLVQNPTILAGLLRQAGAENVAAALEHLAREEEAKDEVA